MEDAQQERDEDDQVEPLAFPRLRLHEVVDEERGGRRRQRDRDEARSLRRAGTAVRDVAQDFATGVVAGSEPDPVDFSYSSDTKDYGLFAEGSSAAGAVTRWQVHGGAISSSTGGEINRDWVYLTGRLTIEQTKLEGDWLSFVTRSQEMLGDDRPWKEVTHRYTGQVTANGIRFTLESGGGYTIHPPVEFTARRVVKP